MEGQNIESWNNPIQEQEKPLLPNNPKSQAKYEEMMAKIWENSKKSKNAIEDLKSEVWIFEGVEPDAQMCAYAWLRIRFPWKNIKSIISVTSSTWWAIEKVKMAENNISFKVMDASWERKNIDKQIISNDVVQFDWTTPSVDYTILSFTVELEDGTKEIIKRKVKLTNKPNTIKAPKAKKSGIDNKVTVEKIVEPALRFWRFVWETPDTKNKPYKDLMLEFSVLPWKKIKRVVSVDTWIANWKSNWPVENISVIDGDKIKFDYNTPNAAWVSMKFKVELEDWTIWEWTKNIALPNRK